MQKNADKKLAAAGVIPGRFQVVHNDHLRYLLAAHRLCDHLIVGITNPDPTQSRPDSADTQRTLPIANPLTYYERYLLVRAVLEEAGCAPGSFSIVPLPISFPERYCYYVPMDALFFVSIYDGWGQRKLDFFKSLHLRTHVLWKVDYTKKGISGSDVRSLMMQGENWEHLVPPASACLLRAWGIAERLKRIARGNYDTKDLSANHNTKEQQHG